MCERNNLINKDLISIIIPIYNTDLKLLNKCLKSCTNQTYTNIEVLLMLNGASKEIYYFAKEWTKKDDRFQIYLLDKKGVSNARNQGIKNSVGEWLVFLDADDWIENDYCEKLYKKIEEYNVDVVISSFYKDYSHKSEENKIVDRDLLIDNDMLLKKILNVQSGVGFVWAKLWKKDILLNNQLFFNTNLIVAEDAEFCLKACKYNLKVLLIPDRLYHYVFSTQSTVRKFNKNYAVQYEDAMIHIMEDLKTDEKLEVNIYNFIAYHLLLICVNYCFNPQNRLNYRAQKKLLKSEISKEIFRKSLLYSTLNDFDLSRKITLFFLKTRLYFCVKLISEIRNKQR